MPRVQITEYDETVEIDDGLDYVPVDEFFNRSENAPDRAREAAMDVERIEE